MSLPHALLTALLEHPGSGSELARRFDRSIGHFWQATHQQIYRELGRLEQAGWVESLPPQSGRGRKRAYRVLPAGREELRRWTAQVPVPGPVRVELMVRLRAEAAIGPTGLRHNIERLLQEHTGKREQYRRIEAQDFPPGERSREQQLQHLVLQGGIMFQTLWVEFCEQALQTLAAAQAPVARARRRAG
ncbi:MAG: PadR family transcriptional regulator [Nevskia sp.]|nr:PadR family transcriptional regulator [Nevskia sp.]